MDSDLPPKDGLKSAFVHNLSRLEPDDFGDQEARAEFEKILAQLTQTGEAIEGAGHVPTTLWLLSDEEAEALAERIVALARRYGDA
jgi:hypothetical protein